MASQALLGGLTWLRWRVWSSRKWTAAAAALIILLTITGRIRFFPASNQDYELSSPSRHSDTVPFTPLSNARKKAAFCLDGSIPGYHMQKGFGSGSLSWLLHIEGGSWCDSVASCAFRKRTKLGSSNVMEPEVLFSGMLSSDPLQNPDFYNWNKVKIRYCDGGSFSGNPGAESKNGTQLFFRGQLIWEATMEQLSLMGLSNARQAFLTGCSAGALATLIHCDDFREALPKDANVKCMADAGLFLNEKDIAGNPTIERFYHHVVQLQGIAKGLNKECLTKTEPHKCFFPHEFIKNIQTPLFFIQPAYDYWQIQNILIPSESDPQRSWLSCKLYIFNCSPAQLKVLHGYRNSFLKALSEFQQNKEGGMFINSCFVHCQSWMANTWNSPSSPRINNVTIAEAVGDWYFNRRPAKYIDCPFPCNPTCYNMDFTRRL